MGKSNQELPAGVQQLRYDNRQLDASTISFRFGMGLAIGRNRIVARLEKVSSGFLATVLLAEDADVLETLDVCFHLCLVVFAIERPSVCWFDWSA